MYEIYCIDCLVDGKRYFGQTCCGHERRRDQHWQNAAGGSKKCPRLYNAMRKHGLNNFTITLWASVDDKAAADRLERYYIADYNTTDRLFGYNQMGGGEGGFLHSEETKTKMKNTATGRIESEETKQKLSDFRKELYRKFKDTVSSEEVVCWYNKGMTIGELAKKYGVILNLIGAKLREGGIQVAAIGHAKQRADRLVAEGKPHLINPDNKELAHLYESGVSIMKLAKIYEMGFQTIFRRLQIAGAKLRVRRHDLFTAQQVPPSLSAATTA